MRLKIIRLVIIALFIVLVLELFYVQVIRGQHYYNLSLNNRIRIVPLEGWRGRIKDRHEKVLADSRISYNILVSPQDIVNIQELFQFLSQVLGVDQPTLIDAYRRKKFTPFAPVAVAENVDRQKAIKIEENKFRFPSLMIQESFKRFYPLERSGAHVIGYVGKLSQERMKSFKEYGYSPPSMVGYSGVEEYYDDVLKGGSGGIQIEVNNRGQQVRLLSIKEPTKGEDITLTIDGEIQRIAQELIEGRVGSIVVMDMANGEVLGLVSSPAFDPNYFVDHKFSEELKAILRHPLSPLLNRAIKGQYPPGSVFKVIMALGGLDSKKITQYTTFNCPGYFQYGGKTFGDTCRYGEQNLIEAIAHSCNVYFYHVGLLIGADLIHKNARLLTLGDLTGIDLPYEEKGFIPHRRVYLAARKSWYAGNTINMSIGQGDILTTPLQLVKMMATVANEGKEVQPHVIKRIGESTVSRYDFIREVKLDSKIFDIVKKGLRAAVTDQNGTARDLNMNEIFVAGKTGTAQSAPNKDHHAWFVGYAQGESKNIAFCVFLEYGGSSHNATALAKQLLKLMHEESLL